MNYYFIDYENVKKTGLTGIEDLGVNDTVYVFYSKNVDTITFDILEKINMSQASIYYIKVDVGSKNALDFQLSSYMGYMIAKEPESKCYLVSKDNGYKALIQFWSQRDVNITILSDLSGKTEDDEKSQLLDHVNAMFDDEVQAKKVTEIILQYKTKLGINNALVKKFPSTNNKVASEIYNKIKPLISNKK